MIIIRYGELALKGNNRFLFENKLGDNLRDSLKRNKVIGKVLKRRGRFFIETLEQCDFLKNIFGVTSYSYAFSCESDMDAIKKCTDGLDVKGSFRVSAKRIDKNFPLASNKVEVEVGGYIHDTKKNPVSLKKFETEVGIEIYNDNTLVFDNKHQCVGGMPLGSASKFLCYVSSELDLYACFVMMKRGCEIVVATEDVDCSFLDNYSYGYNIKKVKPGDFEKIANENECIGLVLGQTLGEIESLSSLIELRPLVGMSKEEIKTEIEALK